MPLPACLAQLLLDVTVLGDTSPYLGYSVFTPSMVRGILGGVMRPSRRRPVNKRRSARQFRGNVQRTKGANLQRGLARGGWRL